MEERPRDDGFEATFVVATPRPQAWKYLTEASPVSDRIPGPRPGQWWIPCIEGAADEVEVEPESLLRTRKATFPCAGTEIVITLEDEGGGTRITIVQNGFGPDSDEQRPWLAAGWYPILADFTVFFERGVSLGRHVGMWSNIGCGVSESPGGLVVTDVTPGGFAAQAGMQAHDVIVQLAGAPVLTVRDLSMVMRGPLRSGTEAKIRYLRGESVLTGRGVV